MDKFAERIKGLRTQKDISQEELGNIVGVGKQAVSSWERNESKPRSDVLNQLADFFTVTTDYLLGRTDIPNAKVVDVTDQIPKEILKELDIDVAYREVLINAKEAKISPEELAAFVDALSKIKKQGG